jgi:hypothetical protein
MYIGRYQLGKWIDIYLQVMNGTLSPLLPDAVPAIKIFGPAGIVLNAKMPIVDKIVSPGLFCSRILLGNPFSTGQHAVEMFYLLSGSPRIVTRNFDIIPAGNPLGQVVGMHYFHQPQGEFVIFQVESGRLLKGKNPRVN